MFSLISDDSYSCYCSVLQHALCIPWLKQMCSKDINKWDDLNTEESCACFLNIDKQYILKGSPS